MMISLLLFCLLATAYCISNNGRVLKSSSLSSTIVAVSKDKAKSKEDSVIFKLPDGVKNGIASGLAAAVVKTVLQPLDTIKTVQQAQKMGLDPFRAMSKVISRNGIFGLWAGLGITVVGSSPSVAVYFGVYSSMKKHLTTIMPKEASLLAVALAASIGNTVASVLRVPYEVIKQRMQNGDHTSTFEALRYSWINDGPLGLFNNGKLTSQIVRDVPYAIVTLVSYEILQAYVKGRNQRKEEEQALTSKSKKSKQTDSKDNSKKTSKITDAICGSIAGGLGSFFTTPMDVVKTRMMTDMKGGGNVIQYASVSDCIQRIFKEEGFKSFFIGTGPRLMHKVPANGLFFLCYEWFRQMLDVKERV